MLGILFFKRSLECLKKETTSFFCKNSTILQEVNANDKYTRRPRMTAIFKPRVRNALNF